MLPSHCQATHRFTSNTVLVGLLAAWLCAGAPIRRSCQHTTTFTHASTNTVKGLERGYGPGRGKQTTTYDHHIRCMRKALTDSVKATQEAVVRLPSELAMISARPS